MKLRYLVAVGALTLLTACGFVSDPFRAIKAAETPDQAAFAVQGTFVVYQKLALQLVELPVCGALTEVVCIHQVVKTAIQDAAAVAKPVSDAAANAGLAYQAAKANLDAAPEDETRIASLQRALDTAVIATEEAKPLVNMFKAVIDTAKAAIDRRRSGGDAQARRSIPALSFA